MFGTDDAQIEDVHTLRECCCSISGGKTPSMSHPEYYGGDIPFIKSGDVKEETVSTGTLSLTKEALAHAGVKMIPAQSVLVVIRSAALLREFHAAINTVPVAINQDLKAFVPKPQYNPVYLLWAIKSHETALLSKVQTVLTSHIEMNDLLNIPVQEAKMEKQLWFAEYVIQSDKSKFAARLMASNRNLSSGLMSLINEIIWP